MFEGVMNFFKRFGKNEKENSSVAAKERLHLVLAQDRANISADFLEMMKQEIIEVIKKYIDIDEEAIDVRMTNKPGEDGTVGAPSLYANIPIVTIKNESRKLEGTIAKEKQEEEESLKEDNSNHKSEDIQIENHTEVENEKEEDNNEVEKQEEVVQTESNEPKEQKDETEQIEKVEAKQEIENKSIKESENNQEKDMKKTSNKSNAKKRRKK